MKDAFQKYADYLNQLGFSARKKENPSAKSSMAKNFYEAGGNSEEEEEEERIEDWDDWRADDDDSDPDFLCLFCDQRWASIESLFDHCHSMHSFDFHAITRDLQLDFYGSFKLINYVRSQVAVNKCWSCGSTFQCSKDLRNHLHTLVSIDKDSKLPWQDDIYLKPFMQEDALLHSFGEDKDGEDDFTTSVVREELMRETLKAKDIGDIGIDGDDILDVVPLEIAAHENGNMEASCTMNGSANRKHSLEMVMNDGMTTKGLGSSSQKRKDKNLRVSFASVAAREIKNVNESYFSAYSSFGIHREMINDKVRTDAYREAILHNPSLMKHAIAMDVGCGTGILSLFAAQAGASKVIAVEASEKMAAVATQVAKDNGLLQGGSQDGDKINGVITVVQGMVEELDKSIQVPPNSVDVLLSEWMGYCLLYESMLSSVLHARDNWLKPGGAILPDIATIFAAGFGKGGTTIPFWENVYGFDMSCIGKEVTEDAAQLPIVDVVDGCDIVTNTAILQTFDLVTMKTDDVDFTANIELVPKLDLPVKAETTGCYGIVLWFETAFSSRFCKEMPMNLSTSPYGPKTHWSQTIFTFREPIAMGSVKPVVGMGVAVGTDACPAVRIESRISIARASCHRSIDISVETTALGSDGRKRHWPVQIFNL